MMQLIKLWILTFVLMRRLFALFAFIEKSYPWTNNATGDGTSGGYTALEWSEMQRRLFNAGGETSQCVVKGFGNELAVSGSASPLAVGTGAAVVYGKWYYNDASLNLSVATPTVGTTGGHVILQLDWSAQTVRAQAVRNTDGLSATPSLTQSTSTKWEVRLAKFSITTGGVITLTDTRGFLHIGTRVGASMIDADSVDDTQVGNRVPQLRRRQGGDISDWSIYGSTSYTPTAVRMQAGSAMIPLVTGQNWAQLTVTLPEAFSDRPLALASVAYDGALYAGVIEYVRCIAISASQIELFVKCSANQSTGYYVSANWLAIGPE